MLIKILFVIYAALIPLVPLWGARYYSKKEDASKKTICYVLFAVQIMLSFGSILTYLGAA
ncbi:MAG: hypothetical protein K6G56_02325 [Clostridiales bacterium]|nr:hypothetical protein [Clostridiales bacterium]